MATIKKIKIHPAIGIARLGDHPTATFDGPQKPFDDSVPVGGYTKDGKIKRQAAVFRLFGYDAKDKLVGEITAKEADIRWNVELANKKAFGKIFDGPKTNVALRNKNVPANQRHRLAIQPTSRFVDLTKKNAKFDDGKFTSWKKNGTAPKNVNNIFLGELKMDKEGFLRVLGANGRSESAHNIDINDYANNDSWFDDVADGPVNATVTLADSGETFEAEAAWVICAPPSFAPQLRNIVTMYDIMLQRAVERKLMPLPAEPSFAFDIYPVLKASFDVKFVHDVGFAHQFQNLLVHNSALKDRKELVKRLRLPNGSGGNMPRLQGDNGRPGVSLTKLQHHILGRWAAGKMKFKDVHKGPPATPKTITPEGMDRAALESMVGGGFFPGIECGWFMRDKYDLVDGDMFRLSVVQNNPQCPLLKAGDVTKQMALPWQADFTECRREGLQAWWPAARPDEVFFGSSATTQTRWAGNIDEPATPDKQQYKLMMQKWKSLGFVVKSGNRYEVK